MKIFILMSLCFSLSGFAKTCGLEGTVDERIKNCAEAKGNFVLIAATEKGMEFYKDIKSGLIWGSRVVSDFNHYGSQMACDQEVSGYGIMGSMKWRLPTINELEAAAAHGMKAALSDMDHAYWSSTPVKHRSRRGRRTTLVGAFLWDGAKEKSDAGDLKDGASVRCVSKE